MRFASALTTKTDWAEAVEDLGRQISVQLGPAQPELAILFVHPQYVTHIDSIVESVQKAVGAQHLIGCTGAGIIGIDQEVEQKPAISLLVGELPGVQVVPFHVTEKDLEESTGPAFWHFQLELEPAVSPQFLLFADPFTTHAVQLVDALTEAYPQAPMIGGLASGARQPGGNRLFLDLKTYDEGAVGIRSSPIALASSMKFGMEMVNNSVAAARKKCRLRTRWPSADENPARNAAATARERP